MLHAAIDLAAAHRRRVQRRRAVVMAAALRDARGLNPIVARRGHLVQRLWRVLAS